MLRRERNEYLRLKGGRGRVVTYTTWLKKWVFFGEPDKLQLTTITLKTLATVGKHRQTADMEICITFNRNIRFNGRKQWRPISICRKGRFHSIQNLSEVSAKVYSLKV